MPHWQSRESHDPPATEAELIGTLFEGTRLAAAPAQIDVWARKAGGKITNAAWPDGLRDMTSASSPKRKPPHFKMHVITVWPFEGCLRPPAHALHTGPMIVRTVCVSGSCAKLAHGVRHAPIRDIAPLVAKLSKPNECEHTRQAHTKTRMRSWRMSANGLCSSDGGARPRCMRHTELRARTTGEHDCLSKGTKHTYRVDHVWLLGVQVYEIWAMIRLPWGV